MSSDRQEIAASALASLRADAGDPPADVLELIARWEHGEVPTATLTEARRLLARGESIAHLTPARA